MSSKSAAKQTGGRHHRSRADKKRRGRRYGLVILGIPTLALLFYLVDRSGPIETVAGSVVETSSYLHSGTDGSGEHSHLMAVLEYEGHRFKLDRADRYQTGDAVSVEVRRGRMTGYPYFVQAWK